MPSWYDGGKKFWNDYGYKVFPALKPGYWYGDYDERKYRQYEFFHDGLGNYFSLGLTSKLIDSDIANAKNQAYMKRWGLTYGDIVDPTRLYDSEDTSVAMLNFVSDNIKRLYH